MTHFKTIARLPLLALTALPMLLAPAAMAQSASQPQPAQSCQPATNGATGGAASKPCTPRNGAGHGHSGRMNPNGSNRDQAGQQGREGRGGRHGGVRGGGPAIGAAVARTLGLTDQALTQQLQGGKTVADLAKARGVSTVSIHNAALSALRTQLAADVKAGKLDQTRATATLTQAQADANFGLNMGRHGGPGRHGDHAQGDAPKGQGKAGSKG